MKYEKAIHAEYHCEPCNRSLGAQLDRTFLDFLSATGRARGGMVDVCELGATGLAGSDQGGQPCSGAACWRCVSVSLFYVSSRPLVPFFTVHPLGCVVLLTLSLKPISTPCWSNA